MPTLSPFDVAYLALVVCSLSAFILVLIGGWIVTLRPDVEPVARRPEDGVLQAETRPRAQKLAA